MVGLRYLAVSFFGAVTCVSLGALGSQQKFSLQQVGVNKTTKSVFHEIRSTYWKYGWDAPEHIEAGVERVERMLAEQQQGVSRYAQAEQAPPPISGSVSAQSIRGDLEYLINVQVGAHSLMLDLDTGSSDLWVMSTLLQPGQRLNKPTSRLYDPQRATPMSGASWAIRYGDMSTASGKVFVDKVSIGTLEVDKQAVEAAANMSSSFAKGGSMDGLLGLAMTRLNRIKPQAQPTWFENIRTRLAEPVFVSLLKRHTAGSYDFGFIDKAKFKGELAWQTVTDSRGFWDFKVEGLQVGGGSAQSIAVTAVADTGSSLWYAPTAFAEAYWKQVSGASFNQMKGGYIFPCSAKLPDVKVNLAGGRSVNIAGINLNYQSIGSSCFGGLQRNTGMPMSIFGDTFLKGLYVAFEHKTGQQSRIGLANAV